MENKVKNVYMAYLIDNSQQYGNYISVSGIGFSAQEFALDLWFYILEGSNILLSQKNGFSLGVDNGKIVLRVPSLKTLTVTSNVMMFTSNTWNNIYMGFDGKEICFYVNGIEFGSVCCDTNILNSEDFILGEEFTGYIRYFRLYNKKIAVEEYNKYCYAAAYNDKDMPHIAAFMDLTDAKIPDLSGGSGKASVHEGCSLVDLVDVYCPSEGRYSEFSNSREINPGGFSTGAFSVYTKLYIRPSSKKRHILTANGNSGEEDAVITFAETSQEGVAFGICLGNSEFLFESEIGIYSWVDLIFSVSGKQITVYINGIKYIKTIQTEFQRIKGGDFKIGGCKGIPESTCEHYLHTVAVFDKLLENSDAESFLENHPFIFENGLIALINFEGGRADELLGGGQISTNQSDLFPAQRTVDKIPDSPYRYRMNYDKNALSKMEIWKAELLITEYQCFVEETYGFSCYAKEDAIAALVTFVSHNKPLMQKISDLYMKPKITPDEVSQVLSKIGRSVSKTLYKALNLAAGAHTISSSSAAIAGILPAISTGLYYALLGTCSMLVFSVARIIADRINDKHRDKPDDDDKDVILNLSSITFQHDPDNYTTSAVRCRNYLGVIKGAEWTRESKCIYPAVYIAEQIKKVKIKIKFKIKGSSTKQASDTYKVSFKASVIEGETHLFDDFQYERSGLFAEQEYEAVLESAIEASVEKDFSYSKIKLWWSCYINDKSIDLPNTDCEVYVIPTTPCPPIALEENCPDDLIAIEYLKIMTRMLRKSTEKKESVLPQNGEADFLSFERLQWLAYDLYFSPYFKYVAGKNKYVSWREIRLSEKDSCMLICFNEKLFLSDISSYSIDVYNNRFPKIEIQCDEYAAILFRLFLVRGISSRLSFVYNPERGMNGYIPLKISGVYPAGSNSIFPQNFDFRYHMIVEVSPQDNLTGMDGVRVFDASLGVKDNQNRICPLAGLPFYGRNGTKVNRIQERDTYRGLAVQDGTGAIIASWNIVFARV